MKRDLPILLNFYALTNGKTDFFFGQLVCSVITDFSFKEFSRSKTISTLLDLYRIRALPNHDIELIFDMGSVKTRTDRQGRFQLEVDLVPGKKILHQIVLNTGEEVSMIDGLYPFHIHHIDSPTIVISDIDDTLLHSFIRNKMKMFRTLVFSTVEKRRAVDDMMQLLKRLSTKGASIFYLSNSEQNLYPMIYRFLQYNEFPQGPLFLRQLRRLTDVVLNRKRPLGDSHKINSLRKMIKTFPDKQFILIGDNTQNDLLIYLQMAEEFRDQIRHIVIRRVHERKKHKLIVEKAMEELRPYNISVYYSDEFPSALTF